MTAKNPTQTEVSFFDAKRSWSVIKDRVLGSYMRPYLTKVRRLGRPIILVDCFAGEGKFGDDQPGSPLIMCEMAEKYGNENCRCLLVNEDKSQHRKLEENVQPFIKKKIAFPILGDSQSLLREVGRSRIKFTLFVYLDPFGLKGCEFGAIKELLERGDNRSTEILINVSMPILHRLAAPIAVKKEAISPRIATFHKILNDVFGGDYWRQHMFNQELSPDEKELRVMQEYRARLKKILPYVGSCPVREKEGARIKYFTTFCSRHPDAMTLMNNFMCTAYNNYLHQMSKTTFTLLAAGIPDWRTMRTREKAQLKSVIREEIKTNSRRTRLQLWQHIVEKRFMEFLEPEYKAVVKEMLAAGEIESPTPRKSARQLNDNCILKLTEKEDG